MNPYQQKWLDILNAASLPGWEIEPVGENIHIKMPHVDDLKVIRDNLPEIIAALSLDIDIPKEHLQLIIENGFEKFEYTIE